MINECDIKALSLYCRIKATYSNSTIYNFSYNKVAKLFKIAPQTVKKYINHLIEYDYARLHNGNLTMIATRKTTNKRKGWVKFDIKGAESLKEIQELLYYVILKDSSRQQAHIIKLKDDIYKMKNDPKFKASPKRIKKLKRAELDYKGKSYNSIILATRKTSEKLGISHSKVAYLYKRLTDRGLIKVNRLIEKLSDEIYYFGKHGKIYHNLGFGYCFIKDSRVYIDRGSQLVFYPSSIILTSNL